ncbi:oligosaccharide flippase family protein [Oceanobacillus sp. Castelsardo]|uniref:oligosaccharide flippase family protein n=1 Tax=Oceanobacillus sp. Castelsardo TaxID=1851204 RepID=UPI0008397054|nr:oligosaccharide flippase family protein [Oceanobacillus sp. Castelsardo]
MNEFLKKLMQKGLFHIFGSNLINKIINFCSGIFLVRLLSKTEFGNYSYSQNILNIFLLFNGLGVLFALLQFGSEESDVKRNLFYKLGFKVGILSNLVISILMIFYALTIEFPNEQTQIALILMSFIPLFMFLYEFIQNYLRTGLLNKEFSFLNTLNSFLIFTFSIIGAISFGVYGVIIAFYISYLISIIFGSNIIRTRFTFFNRQNSNINSIEKKNFMGYSIISMFNNVISQILYLIDIFLIGLIIHDPQLVATYKTATLIPFALNFIPLSIMTFVYPYFAKNRKEKQWVKLRFKKMVKILLLINSFLVFLLIIGAPFIIRMLFGSNYSDSDTIQVFRILCFGYLIAGTLRIPAGNLLSMLRHVKPLFIINLFVGIVNIGLDIILINNYSIYGAAITTVTIICLSSVIYIVFLNRKLKA